MHSSDSEGCILSLLLYKWKCLINGLQWGRKRLDGCLIIVNSCLGAGRSPRQGSKSLLMSNRKVTAKLALVLSELFFYRSTYSCSICSALLRLPCIPCTISLSV